MGWIRRRTLGTGEVRTPGEEVEWEMNWQCNGKSPHGDLPFSSSSPLQATPSGEGLTQAALVGGEEEKIPSCSSGEKGSSCGLIFLGGCPYRTLCLSWGLPGLY